MKKLDSRKVIEEITFQESSLNKRIENEDDFEDVHKDILRLCKIIFKDKKEYKDIDVAYSSVTSPIVRIGVRYSEGENKVIEIPARQEVWLSKKAFANKILCVLGEAKKLYTMREGLEVDK